jgi:hypothetical protein
LFEWQAGQTGSPATTNIDTCAVALKIHIHIQKTIFVVFVALLQVLAASLL